MSSSSASSGISFMAVLGLVFVVLKLTDVIDWSWWWVLLPFWFGTAVALAIILIAFVCIGFAALFKLISRRR